MAEVAGIQRRPSLDWLRSLPHQHTIHNHIRAEREVFRHKFMFGRNIRRNNEYLPGECNLLPPLQVAESDQNVVIGVQFQYYTLHHSLSSPLRY